MDHSDVVIVGAGFAGLECARVTAKHGLRTVVLERKADPGTGVHTTGLLVKEVTEYLAVPSRLTRKISGVRLYSPSLRWVDLESPGYYFLATDTPALMRLLLSKALNAGAEVRCRSEYRGSAREAGLLKLPDAGLSTRFLVGADGPHSRVAKGFGLGQNHRFLVGVETEYEGVRALDENRLHCFLDSDLAPGYIAWVIPGVGVTQVGLACSDAVKPDLAAFVTRISKLFNFDGARIVGRRGGLIPVGGPVFPAAAVNVLLVGDAAGLVSPLTAGGIHTALYYGRKAGAALCEHILWRGPEPADVLAAAYPRFFWKKVFRSVFDCRPPNWVLDAAFSMPALRDLARMMFFHHRGIFSIQALREMVVGSS